MFAIYILVAFDIRGGYRNYLLGITIEFISFILLGIRYGVFGFKFKLEKYRLDSTMKAMTSGTVIFNHTVKNEMNKISLALENIKSCYGKPELPQSYHCISDHLNTITKSTVHLSDMVSKIQEHAREIVLAEELNSIKEIIDTSLENMSVFFEERKIVVSKIYTGSYQLICDGTHLKEVLHNIFQNAIEAMGTGGSLQIEVYENRKTLVVKISDSGAGIPKNTMPLVFDPFFSTKSRKTNFGLGLSYCFNVMQKHNGVLKIESEENIGTTIFLMFPSKKLCKL